MSGVFICGSLFDLPVSTNFSTKPRKNLATKPRKNLATEPRNKPRNKPRNGTSQRNS